MDDLLKTLSLSEEEFKKLDNPNYDLTKEKEENVNLLSEAYRNIIDVIKKYVDVDELYYPIISTWVIGTYIHEHFRSYPFLFFNAMKGSGKTRILKLVTTLAKDGEMCNSMTEAVLFRTTGTLAIDEFEGVTRKGNEALRELLNASYKKGSVVKRMKKVKTMTGEEQRVEKFNVYRPIVLANIWGMENVLADRCLSVVLEKSDRKEITRLIELFDEEPLILATKELLLRFSGVLWNVVSVGNLYKGWNEYVTNNYISPQQHNSTKLHLLYDKLKESEIDGRHLELSLPLFIIGWLIDEKVLDLLIENVKKIVEERKIDDIYNNKDVALIDFVSQEIPISEYVSVTELARKFREFVGEEEEWINAKFVGRALERVKLILKRKKMSTGNFVMLDYLKAQQKIKMFK